MRELLKKFDIYVEQSNEKILEELGKKQIEYLERLDNVGEEQRRRKLENELKEIEQLIHFFTETDIENVTGIKRDNFAELKNREDEIEKEELLTDKRDFENVQKALVILENEDAQKGYDMLYELALSGNCYAQFKIGCIYSDGEYMEPNWEQANEWFRKAAEQNLSMAQFNLGNSYFNGCGVEKDEEKAVYWWKKAAEQGDVIAQIYLAECYRDGAGVVQNDQEAAIWYEKAAEQGNDVAQAQLGNKYIQGIGVEKSKEKAIYWWKKAAYQKNMQAIDNLCFFGIRP